MLSINNKNFATIYVLYTLFLAVALVVVQFVTIYLGLTTCLIIITSCILISLLLSLFCVKRIISDHQLENQEKTYANNNCEELNKLVLQKEDKIKQLELKIVELNLVCKSEDQILVKNNYIKLLRHLQILDIATIETKDLSTNRLISKALRDCGMQFVDYCNETDELYSVEEANIDEIDVVCRTIQDLSTKQVLLVGKVYLPRK